MSEPVTTAPAASDIATALEGYAAAVPARPQNASLRGVAVVLISACVVAVALDSEGLVTWARRQEVGPVQDALLRVVVPVHGALSAVGLGTPRKWVASLAPQTAQDPLLAEGWVGEEIPVPALVGPAPVEPLRPVEGEPERTAPAPAVVVDSEGWGGVLVLGDSMIAGSLGSMLERTVAREGLPVTRASQLGTGLARPEVYDWMKVAPALLSRDHPRFVVVSIGSNDATDLRDGEDQVDFGDARWKQVYGARVEAMMRVLTANGARVLWLTLPPMRDRRLSSRAAALNRVFVQVARRVPRVELLELDVLVSGGDRQYATFVQGPDGRMQRYRLDDGIHFAPAGSRVVASWVRDWLRERH